MEKTFLSFVMNHFQYLVSDYDFSVKKIEISGRAPEIEGRIELENVTTFVTVSSEQGAVGASVGRVKDDKYRFFLNPTTIHEYIVLTESDKKLVCSLDPKDDRRVRMIIHKIRLVHQKDDSDNFIGDVNKQLFDYSQWLQQYAKPFLQGDFSQWLKVYEYKVARTRSAYIRSGKVELVRAVGLNKDERISIFQSSLDYLEKLREEYGKR